MDEVKTKEEIVKGAIERAVACGMTKDLKDVIVFLEDEIEKCREKIHSLEECYKLAREDVKEANDERRKVTAELQEKIRNEKSGPEELLRLKIEVKDLKESNAGQAELIRKLKEEVDKLTDRAERAEKEIREMKTIGEIEHGAFYPDDETVITINRKPDEILSVSVLFTNEREEEEDDDGEN